MSSIIESARTLLGLTLPSGAGVGKILMSNGSGVATWQDMIPTGTAMVFYQASAPVGWWTAVALNDYFLRVVTAGGTGGTSGGSWTLPVSVSIADYGHVHSQSAHYHTLGDNGQAESSINNVGGSDGYCHNVASAAWTPNFRGGGVGGTSGPVQNVGAALTGRTETGTSPANTGTSGCGLSASGSATHGYAQHKYADIIICTKN